MYITKVGQSYQVRRVTYNSELKKNTIKILFSFKIDCSSIPQDKWDLLTNDEKLKLEEFINEQVSSSFNDSVSQKLETLVNDLISISEFIELNETIEVDGNAIFNAIKQLEKALKSKGFKKQAEKVKSIKKLDNQLDLIP